MVLIKHNYLKSDIFFNPIFVPGFSGFGSRVQVFRVRFEGSGSGSRVRVQVIEVALELKEINNITHFLLLKAHFH